MRNKAVTFTRQILRDESWEALLLRCAQEAMAGRECWLLKFGEHKRSIHLAVLVEPYLQYIIDGDKTVESRFSANRCAPYQKVKTGDLVLLKRSGGPVVAFCEVSHAWYYELDPGSWHEIRKEFATALCAQDPEFWKSRERAEFATLMRIKDVTPVVPFSCSKRDRRGWAVVREEGLPEQATGS